MKTEKSIFPLILFIFFFTVSGNGQITKELDEVVYVQFIDTGLQKKRPIITPEQQREAYKIAQMDYHECMKTLDRFYMADDSIPYLMSKSMLHPNKHFQDLYYSELPEITEIMGEYIFCIDKNYKAYWVLADSMVYLSDIDGNGFVNDKGERFPSEKNYAKLENLTGVKFQKGIPEIKSGIPHSPLGMMPATWVNGIYYLKKSKGQMSHDKWDTMPYIELVIKNGILVSTRNIPVATEKKSRL